MHLVVINCSPRIVSDSNTNIIIQAFSKGYTEDKNTVELYHLSQKNTWQEIRTAFYNNEYVLMAIPLYVECIPGIMMEFLETLPPKHAPEGKTETKLSFILQGGFAEASQLRCGERYLEKLPALLHCTLNGILVKGNMFIVHMMPPRQQEKLVEPFVEMGRRFAREQTFSKAAADQFAGPEYFSKSFIAVSTLLSPLQRLFFHFFFKGRGCQGRLTAKPYRMLLK